MEGEGRTFQGEGPQPGFRLRLRGGSCDKCANQWARVTREEQEAG